MASGVKQMCTLEFGLQHSHMSCVIPGKFPDLSEPLCQPTPPRLGVARGLKSIINSTNCEGMPDTVGVLHLRTQRRGSCIFNVFFF